VEVFDPASTPLILEIFEGSTYKKIGNLTILSEHGIQQDTQACHAVRSKQAVLWELRVGRLDLEPAYSVWKQHEFIYHSFINKAASFGVHVGW
jgi:hypothetical protein